MAGNRLHESCDVEVIPTGLASQQIISDIIKREKEKDPHFEDAFYTIDLNDVSRKMTTWKATVPRVKPFYAVKANNDRYILSTLASLGAGFDCASQAEIASVLDLGVHPSKIVYAHTIKPPTHLRYAKKVGVDLMTFDNKEELLKIKDLHPHARLIVRIKPSGKYKIDFKLRAQFGCTVAEAPALLKTAKDLELNVVGVSFHVGSGIHDGRVFLETISWADQVFGFSKDLGFEFTILDVGGGFFGKKNAPVRFEEIAHHLNQALDTHFPPERGVEIIAEPGRYFATSCTTLTMSVIGKNMITEFPTSAEADPAEGAIQANIGSHWDEPQDRIVSDSTAEGETGNKVLYFVNDGRHGSIGPGYFLISGATEPFVLQDVPNRQLYRSAVFGPTCNSKDRLFEDCMLPDLNIGDWIYLENMGAYISVLGTAFNGFPVPKSFYVRSSK